MDTIILRKTVDSQAGETACDFLASRTGLSRGKVKDAMNKGAVWIGKGKGRLRRLRRATAAVNKGDRIEFYYDEKLLLLKPLVAVSLSDRRHYSVWYKPPGLVAQGTMYGDHCSLLRQTELFFRSVREVFLVHRLDREASGLMLVAHSRVAAARLSGLFQKNLIVKEYRAEVVGKAGEKGRHGNIAFPLDGKPSLTEFEVESYDPEKNTSIVNVRIKTGRLHQIRRHFDMIGFPVIGDPKYGKGNKNREGMKLKAVSLRFLCPFENREVKFTLPPHPVQYAIE
jgi:tRNA pseudouridine32 synthase/23S rRNA pseudouridine746 synthase